MFRKELPIRSFSDQHSRSPPAALRKAPVDATTPRKIEHVDRDTLVAPNPVYVRDSVVFVLDGGEVRFVRGPDARLAHVYRAIRKGNADVVMHQRIDKSPLL